MRSNSYYKKGLRSLITAAFIAVASMSKAQIALVQDYENTVSPTIGTFQGIEFKEAGFSGLYAIPGTNGKEFWTVSDRGVNVDGANANPSTCRPTYDKIYGFPTYAPKIHRIRLNGSSVEILQTITMKRPNGTNASGIINPTGFGSTALEVASTDTVLTCDNFNLKTTPKDEWGIDSEGIVVDADGNFWICEEGGPTIWKLNPNGVVLQRYTPYANQPGSLIQDIQIDSVFEFRKNNRGFEGIALTPNGKIYAFIQSPLLYPTKTVGENSRIHRILEIDPSTNQTQMFVYLNDGIIGASGSNQIRLRDWKIGDAHAINNTEFLVLEAAARGTSDIKSLYKIDISNATPVTGGLYGGLTLEALVDAAGLAAHGIVPVQKTLHMDLLANGWNPILDKAEGIAIIDANTIAICNDNDFGQYSPTENGVAVATGKNSHVYVYSLSGANALANYVPAASGLNQGITGLSTTTTPYLQPLVADAQFTSILTVGDQVGGYKMVGIPDGAGAFDNNDGTFTMLISHELNNAVGVTRAHGSIGAFVSKWVINKSDLSVVSGSDLIQSTYLWNSTTNAYEQQTAIFNRFCSSDLAPVSAFYNSATGNGSQERIFLNGEEAGAEGRAFANIASGVNAGVTFQLPRMGRYSFENALASPVANDKTIVIGTDDTTPGEVYVYVGTKTNTGNEIERAGLTNGSLYGVAVTGLAAEVSASIPADGTTFTLASLGNVENMTGAALQTASTTASVTKFLRPEDGAWDPTSPNDFYFATTNNFTSPSRLWKLHFTDISNPELGGTITAVLDGTEGPKMIDNLCIDEHGIALLQEDVGNQTHLGKIWQYNTNNDELKLVAQHDPARFIAGAPNFLTQDEEASGIIDVQDILGAGQFLLVDQAHYSIGGELVEGGQILSFYNPDSYNANAEISVASNSVSIAEGDNADFGFAQIGIATPKNFVISNTGSVALEVSSISFAGADASLFTVDASVVLPLTIAAGSNATIKLNYTPDAQGISVAEVVIANTDADESSYNFSLSGNGVLAGIVASSSSATPYLLPTIADAQFTSILTVGDQVGGYKMVGIPDGAGAFDNNDGTFTMLISHELNNAVGVTRAHGSIGAFVSKWVINKSDLSVVSGSDLIQTTYLWNSTTSAYEQQTAIFNRFCSSDLAPVSAFYNSATGNGSQERIFLNGEESGAEGRAFANIASGVNSGTTFQLPRMGRYSFENALASPVASDKTIVIGTDDTTPGEVYVYVGTKTNTGNEIERAGLTNGSLYGVAVSGLAAEVSASIPADGTTFTLASLGNVENLTGAALQTASTTASVTKFLRPEDGAWDPTSPNDFYFATTNNFTSPSRLWKLHFTDISNPELGGTITAVLDGTEGPKMIDNMCIDENGLALLQEDVGNQTHLGKIWQYNTNNDELKLVAQHDPARFIAGAPNFLTQDEEASGIIDVQDILGAGQFLLVDQAHYSIGGELVEGGQILSFYNPDSRDAYCATYATYTEFACDSYTWYDVMYTESGTYTHLSTNEEGCVFTETLNLTINTTSASAPAAVYGDGYACDYIAEATTTTYSVDEVAGETYTWTAPNGMTILSGQGTSEILVSFSSAFSTSNLKVKATNSCGTSGFKLFKIRKLAPVLNTSITGINHVCSGDVVTYTVGSVAGASVYTWTAPVGSTIVDGQGTNVVTVAFNEGFVSSSSISVVASNGCGNSVTKTKPVFKNIIAKPSAIAGAKYGNCQNTGVYSVTNVAGITYNWTVIVGDMDIIDGQGTNEVLVDFGNNFTSGVILVTANNGCGTSVPRSIVLYANPAEITAINGASTVASGSTQSYSVAQVAGATSYTWYVPNGASIVTGQGTSSISVLFGNSSGDILVMASNACGNSFIKSKSVTVQSAPSAFVVTNEVEMNSTFTVSPNPSNGEFILSGDIAANAEISIEVLDVTGRVVYSNNSMNADSYLNVSISLSEIPNGMYFVNVKNNGQLIESIRMVKQ